MNDLMSTIKHMMLEHFPDAVCVEIFVNSDGVEIKPKYKGELSEYSMKTISGNWCSKAGVQETNVRLDENKRQAILEEACRAAFAEREGYQ